MIDFPHVYAERDDHPAHDFTLENRGGGNIGLCSQVFKGTSGTWVCNRPEEDHPGKWKTKKRNASAEAIANARERERKTPKIEEILAGRTGLEDLFETPVPLIVKAKRHFENAEAIKSEYDALVIKDSMLRERLADEISFARTAAYIAGIESDVGKAQFEEFMERNRARLR